MGCINSTKSTQKGDGFRVRVIRIQPDNSTMARYGFLEITKKELIFIQQGNRGNVIWALQHLRRYGLNEDIFSFEAGRRCMSGPGIYTFRCTQNSERLYEIFQRNVNAVSSVTNEEMFGARAYEHPSHTLGRPDASPHSNNYLEPAPLPPAATSLRIQALQESFSSSPLSLLDSPDSVPSLSFTNEMIHFPSQQQYHGQQQQQQHQQTPTTPGTANSGNMAALTSSYANASAALNSNLYSEHPLRSHTILSSMSTLTNQNQQQQQFQRFFGTNSAHSTLQRRTLIKHTSLDAPLECAPLPPTAAASCLPIETEHNYANVEISRSCERILDASERCYENLGRLDLPLLLKPPPPSLREEINEKDNENEQLPMTPGCSGVNYIVLDLDQPQSSPKTCFGSGLSLMTGERSESTSMDLQSPPLTAGLTSTSLKEQDEIQFEQQQQQQSQQQQQQQHEQQQQETSLGYSTIDFIKTCALIKSSTHGGDFDLDTEEPDADESRITRHSKCVRKAYSISE